MLMFGDIHLRAGTGHYYVNAGLTESFAKREGRNQLDDFPEPFLNQWGANAEAIEACKK